MTAENEMPILDALEDAARDAERIREALACVIPPAAMPENQPSSAENDAGCGGCRGIGSHRRHCPRHPDYHPFRLLADRAESIGDSIGVPELANQAWALAGAIRDAIPRHPYRPIPPGTSAEELCGLKGSSDVGYCICIRPKGHELPHACVHEPWR